MLQQGTFNLRNGSELEVYLATLLNGYKVVATEAPRPKIFAVTRRHATVAHSHTQVHTVLIMDIS